MLPGGQKGSTAASRIQTLERMPGASGVYGGDIGNGAMNSGGATVLCARGAAEGEYFRDKGTRHAGSVRRFVSKR